MAATRLASLEGELDQFLAGVPLEKVALLSRARRPSTAPSGIDVYRDR